MIKSEDIVADFRQFQGKKARKRELRDRKWLRARMQWPLDSLTIQYHGMPEGAAIIEEQQVEIEKAVDSVLQS